MANIYFYGHKSEYFNCFSNFYLCCFFENNKQFGSSEQYIMYKKALLMGDNEIADKIIETSLPSVAKRLGRQVKPFDNELWNKHKFNIGLQAITLKFNQNDEIRRLLLATENRVIAEASPSDKIWGIGLSRRDAEKGVKWRGKNMLGEILMTYRNLKIQHQ